MHGSCVLCGRSLYRYRDHRYKNQPLKIEDYEPGFHSSIAQNQAKTVSTSESSAQTDIDVAVQTS